MNKFKYKEDYHYFLDKLARGDKELFSKKYSKLFDFRCPDIKRKEFNKIRSKLYNELVLKFGEKCQLRVHPECSKEKIFDVDHFIPLSTNKLNKEIRNIQADKGKKVPSQSFGSNDISNLKISCKKCNSYKKHRFLFN